MAYDKQTRRLYAWEDQFLEWNCWDPGLSLTDARRIVRWACRMYGVKPPTVRWLGRRSLMREYPHYDPEGHAINLNRRSNNLSRTIHEAAHAVHDWLFGPEGEIHPPEFVGIYAHLIEKKKLAPRSAVLPSLAAAGVVYIHPAYMTPKAIRARYGRALTEASLVRQYGD